MFFSNISAATDKKQLQKMLSTLHGHVVSFLRHPVASAGMLAFSVYRIQNNTMSVLEGFKH
jgi:hypothetical protein